MRGTNSCELLAFEFRSEGVLVLTSQPNYIVLPGLGLTSSQCHDF